MGVSGGGVNIRVAATVGAVELTLHSLGEIFTTVSVKGGINQPTKSQTSIFLLYLYQYIGV